MNKVLRSSYNSEKLSLTIKGLLVSLIPIVIMLAAKAGIVIATTDLMEAINAIFGAFAAVMVAFGVIRKIYFKIKK